MFSPNQSGFRQKNSCVHQLMETIYSIFSSFDCNPTLETRVVFLDISKVFDKVWHKGLLFKLESMGIFGDLLNLMESFLSERFQRGLCSCQSSKWVSIKADVPLSSILGSCFFLIYINDLSDSITSNKKPFFDDINFSASNLSSDLQKIS